MLDWNGCNRIERTNDKDQWNDDPDEIGTETEPKVEAMMEGEEEVRIDGDVGELVQDL